jgi:hypothetical protein
MVEYGNKQRHAQTPYSCFVNRKLLYNFQAGVNQQVQQPSQQPQQPLVVNPKTKTALANMLSIRLQSGTAGTPHLSPQQPGAQVKYICPDFWFFHV